MDENYEKDAIRLLDESVKRKELKKVCQDDFDVIKTVGKGSFGRVFMVKKKRYGTSICDESSEEGKSYCAESTATHVVGT